MKRVVSVLAAALSFVLLGAYCIINKMCIRDRAYALRDTQLPVNDRICQFRIVEHQPRLIFEEAEELGNEDRGGCGSTGKA